MSKNTGGRSPNNSSIAPLNVSIVETLKANLQGQIILPENQGYEKARQVYNALIDRRPLLIIRCAGVADVISTVNFARKYELPVSIRGGGHSLAGFAVCNDGIVIDLSNLKSIRVDPQRSTARVGGGCTWGELDDATHAFGLATPGGIISTTGIGGLTLGGGIGYLTRKYGLSCDNLISVDIVTADGQFLTASSETNADLFWGVRGGGGNFGIVTSFEFKLYPVSTVLGGPVYYSVDKTREVLQFFRDYISTAPEDLNALFGFHIGPRIASIPKHLQGLTMCSIVSCYTGPLEKADKVVRPIREFGPPLLDLLRPQPYPALQRMFDGLLSPGLYHYLKADFDQDLTDEAIDIHVKYGPQIPSVESTMNIFPISGAAHHIGKNETAFNYRDAEFVHIIAGVSPDSKNMTQYTSWVRDYWEALHPHSAGGAYINFMMDEGEDRIRATYRDNYERLAALKAKYDLDNLFHMNQNIRPADQ